MTWEEVARARRLGKLTFIWERGLGARIAKDGKVTWLLQRWEGGRGGKSRRIVIGHYPVMTLEDARRVATTPHIHRLEDLVKTYFTTRTKSGRYWVELEARFESEISPGLGGGNRVPSSITKAEIRELIQRKAKRYPVAALRMFQGLRPFFQWLVEQDILSKNPMDGLRPPPKPESRDRILSHEEIRLFWSMAYSLGYPFQQFFHLLLVTGQRRTEVAEMHQLEILPTTWIIPKERSKNGKEHLVYLSPQALAILESFPRPNSKYMFTTTLVTPISGFHKAKQALDEDDEIPNWRIHDLRRTVASEMQRIGILPQVIDKVLNHTDLKALRAIYQRYDYFEEKEQALRRWGNELQSILGGLWRYRV